MDKLQEISSSWGIPDVSIFASLTLQKRFMSKNEKIIPRTATGKLTKEEIYERQIMVKKRIQEFLGDTEIIPK
jgi:ribosomal protein S18